MDEFEDTATGQGAGSEPAGLSSLSAANPSVDEQREPPVRYYLRPKRHIIAIDAFDPPTRGKVEALFAEKKRLLDKDADIGFRAAISSGARTPLTQLLVDQALIRVDIERVNRQLDEYSARRPPEHGLEDLQLWGAIRSDPSIRRIILTACDDDFSLERAVTADRDCWLALSPLERAWTVNNIILDMLQGAPDLVDSVKSYDMADAVNGNVAAWESLHAACVLDGSTRLAQPSQATVEAITNSTPTAGPIPDEPTRRDAKIVQLWNDGKNASQIARELGLTTKTIDNLIGILRNRYGDSVVSRRRRRAR